MMFSFAKTRLIFVFIVFIVLHIGYSEVKMSRVGRYQNLYDRNKCHFPPSTKDLQLFGDKGLLSPCNRIGDPLLHANLTDDLCQTLVDQLLIYCHADKMSLFQNSGLLNTSSLTTFFNDSDVGKLCTDPVTIKYRKDTEWQFISSFDLCTTFCQKNPSICQLQVYMWKLSNLSGSCGGNKTASADPKPTTTLSPTSTTARMTTSTTTTTTTTRSPVVPHQNPANPVKPGNPSTDAASFQRTLENIENKEDVNSGSLPQENSGGVDKPETVVTGTHSEGLTLLSKLFILFGVFSVILIVGAYVAYYKRAQIRAFCCEDPGDIRYRRIREDRKQQAAQPLKNLAF